MDLSSSLSSNIMGYGLKCSYRGYAGERLRKPGISDYDILRVKKGRVTLKGILIPRPELLDDRHLTLKLENGYNVGIEIDDSTIIEKIGSKRKKYEIKEPRRFKREDRIAIITTGGTISSKVDYETGAVRPYTSPEELENLIPELRKISDIEYVRLLNIFSEDMRVDHWIEIAEKTADLINSGARGVIIAHGTDTMHYTAAALSFMLKNLTAPVVLVGAQRSIDRGSTDAVLNLICSAKVAYESDIAEVMVVMHATPSDTYCVALRGTKTRKMHTSRRDAFQPVNSSPIAYIWPDKILIVDGNCKRRHEGKVNVDARMERKVGLLYVWPEIEPDEIFYFVDKGYKGLVIAGTGLGHTPNRIIPAIEKAVESGLIIVLSSQCIYGRVNMHVYSTGRKLLSAGVIPAEDMHPEVALVKLMYVLGHVTDPAKVKEMMLSNISGEISNSISLKTFPPSLEAKKWIMKK